MDLKEFTQLMLCIGPENRMDDPLDTDELELSCMATKLLEQNGFDLCKKDVSFEFEYGRRPLCIVKLNSHPKFIVKFGSGYFGDVSIEYKTLMKMHSISKSDWLYLRVPTPLCISTSKDAFLYEYVEGTKYSELAQTENTSDSVILARLGKSLASIHGLCDSFYEDQFQNLPRMTSPWPTLSSVQLTISQYVRGIGEDFHAFLSLVQDNIELFNALGNEWRSDSVIHGDLRFDNVIVSKSNEPILIDWELSAFGDRRYDLGYIIADCIFDSICRGYNQIDEKWFDKAKTFLRSYYCYLTLNEFSIGEDLNYALDMAALSLLHKVSSLLQHRGRFGRTGYKMVLCIKNILANSSVISTEMERAL